MDISDEQRARKSAESLADRFDFGPASLYVTDAIAAEFLAAIRDARLSERESLFTDVARLQLEAYQKKSQTGDGKKRAYYDGKIAALYDVLVLTDGDRMALSDRDSYPITPT